MAIYHLTAKTGSRSGGQSAAAKAAYIQREGRYAKQPDALVHTHSGNMPEWVESATDYWQAADTHERANGRLFKELEFSLPRELGPEAQRALATEFAEELTGGERLPYTLAIHKGGGGNPHAHLMVSERANDGIERTADTWFKRANKQQPEQGGAAKSTALKPKAWLADTRQAWQEHANHALERCGQAARIDHRSLAAQQEAAQQRGDERAAETFDREPAQHMGPAATAMEREGTDTERGDDNRQRAERNDERQSLYQQARDVAQQVGEQVNEQARQMRDRMRDGVQAAQAKFQRWEANTQRAMQRLAGHEQAHEQAQEHQQGREQEQQAERDDGPEMEMT